jgi:hypothetical protein
MLAWCQLCAFTAVVAALSGAVFLQSPSFVKGAGFCWCGIVVILRRGFVVFTLLPGVFLLTERSGRYKMEAGATMARVNACVRAACAARASMTHVHACVHACMRAHVSDELQILYMIRTCIRSPIHLS